MFKKLILLKSHHGHHGKEINGLNTMQSFGLDRDLLLALSMAEECEVASLVESTWQH